MPPSTAPVIAVVGAGFSGVITALNILRLSPDAKVILFERRIPVGLGAAYATHNPGHRLNVRAGNMSAWPDDPGHFVRWLSREKFAHVRASPQTAAALDEIGLRTFEDLQSWYTAGADEMRRFVGAGPTLTDDHPLLEYHRSLGGQDEPLDLTPLRGDVRHIID